MGRRWKSLYTLSMWSTAVGTGPPQAALFSKRVAHVSRNHRSAFVIAHIRGLAATTPMRSPRALNAVATGLFNIAKTKLAVGRSRLVE